MMIKIKKEMKYEDILINLLYIVFAFYILVFFLGSTKFDFLINSKLKNVIRLVLYGVVAVKYLFIDEFDSKTNFIVLVSFPIVFLSVYYSGYGSLFDYFFLILGFNRENFCKINKIYLVLIGIGISVTVISSFLNIIPNLEFLRIDSTPRYAMGFVYPTDFASHVFFWTCSLLVYLNKEPEIYVAWVISIILAVIIVYYADARLDSISILFLVACSVMLNIKNRYSKFSSSNLELKKIFVNLLVIALFVIPVVLSFLFTYENTILRKINEILSYRLTFGRKAFDIYGVSLFGRSIREAGSGGMTYVSPFFNYFFLDSSYVLILIKYGMTFFLMVFAHMIYSVNRLIDQKQDILIIALIATLVNSVIAHHLLDVQFNHFILLLLCTLKTTENREINFMNKWRI